MRGFLNLGKYRYHRPLLPIPADDLLGRRPRSWCQRDISASATPRPTSRRWRVATVGRAPPPSSRGRTAATRWVGQGRRLLAHCRSLGRRSALWGPICGLPPGSTLGLTRKAAARSSRSRFPATGVLFGIPAGHSQCCLCRSCEASPGSSLSIEGSMRGCLLEVCGNDRDLSTDLRRQVLDRLRSNVYVSCRTQDRSGGTDCPGHGLGLVEAVLLDNLIDQVVF